MGVGILGRMRVVKIRDPRKELTEFTHGSVALGVLEAFRGFPFAVCTASLVEIRICLLPAEFIGQTNGLA